MSKPHYPPQVLSLISSTAYPDVPSIQDLEILHKIIANQSNSAASRIAHASTSNTAAAEAEIERQKKLRKEKKRRERAEEDERERLLAERAALEANEKAGMRLEAIERNRQKEEKRRRDSPAGVKIKKERTASPAPSNASSTSFRPPLPHHTYGNPKKKAKRVLDSDEDIGRDRSMTLASPPVHGTSTSGLKLKLASKARPPDPSPTPSAAAIDFTLPAPPIRPLIPIRPGVQKPMKPGPKRQADVNEDFSNTKTPSQVAFPTFWQGVEPYLRDVREDDLAMLGFKADAPESYDIPPRGRHYTEVWDEEDGLPPGTTPRFPVPNLRSTGNQGTPFPRFVPATELRDETLVDEHRGLGSLTERVVAAVVGGFTLIRDGISPPEEGVSRDAAKVDVVELEDRMKKELRAVMLLGEHDEYDPSKRDDDEITSSLRQCQRLLLQQTTINEARKTRLASLAKYRLAYAEYQSALDGVEKSIEAGWAKRVKKVGTGIKKPPQPGTSGRPPIPQTLKTLVATRKNWVSSVGSSMKARPRGEVLGLPKSSIYEGIEDGSGWNGDDKDKDGDEGEVEDGLQVEGMDVDEVDGGGSVSVV